MAVLYLVAELMARLLSILPKIFCNARFKTADFLDWLRLFGLNPTIRIRQAASFACSSSYTCCSAQPFVINLE